MLHFPSFSGSHQTRRFFISVNINIDKKSPKAPLILLANETKLPQEDSKVKNINIVLQKLYKQRMVKVIWWLLRTEVNRGRFVLIEFIFTSRLVSAL